MMPRLLVRRYLPKISSGKASAMPGIYVVRISVGIHAKQIRISVGFSID
ncbi:MAG: hypothetical protein ISQ21_04195 [Alphaproteobacteria bacterium]|nr:hypothetical protein [Alphaproteobacteria bacterium]